MTRNAPMEPEFAGRVKALSRIGLASQAALMEDRGLRERLNRSLAGQFDGASEQEKDSGVQGLIHAAAIAAGVIALQPIPLLDSLLIVPIHVAMVQGIARIRGYRLDKKSALEVLRSLRTGLLTQHLAMAGAKFVPAVGWAFSVAVAHALTYAIGQLTDRYFRSGRSMLPTEMRATLKRLYDQNLARIYKERAAEAKAKLEEAPGER